MVAELEGTERTFKEVRTLLEPYEQPGVSPTFIWRRIQGQAYVVHVPPSGIWGYGGHGVYTVAEGTVRGAPPAPDEAFDHLVRSYLAAYGPATKQDIGQWAGIPGSRRSRRRSSVRRCGRSWTSKGAPSTTSHARPLPDADTAAPVRLVPRFDNLVVSHADRSRILGDIPPSRIVTKNAIVHATILVDGFVAGTWQLDRGRVSLEPFVALFSDREAGSEGTRSNGSRRSWQRETCLVVGSETC